MPIYIYQLGDYVLSVRGSSIASLKVSQDRQWREGLSTLTHVPGVYSHGTRIRGLPVAGEVSISGTLIGKTNGCDTIDQELSRIMELAGKPGLDVIGYIPNIECPNPDCGGACGSCPNPHSATWLHTTAIITSVSRGYEEGVDGDVHATVATGVTIGLRFDSYWEPLSHLHWRYYGKNRPTAFGSSASAEEFHEFPRKVDMCVDCRRWREGFARVLPPEPALCKDTAPDLWWPAYMQLMYGNPGGTWEVLHPGWRTAVLSSPIGVATIVTAPMLIGGGVQHDVIPPVEAWNAPPRSLYQFTDPWVGGGTDDLTITVTRTAGPYERVTEETVLSYATVHADMLALGYTGAQAVRFLYTGACANGLGYAFTINPISFRREMIPILPRWQYKGLYPGETGSRWNKVAINGPASGRLAYLHIFRAL